MVSISAKGLMFQCPLCKHENGTSRARIGEYEVVQCGGCRVISTFPLPTPQVLRAIYADSYYGGPEAARFRFFPLQWAVQGFRWRRAQMLQRRLGSVAGRWML